MAPSGLRRAGMLLNHIAPDIAIETFPPNTDNLTFPADCGKIQPAKRRHRFGLRRFEA